MRYFVIVENQEEEIIFKDYIEGVPSIEILIYAIKKYFYPCCGHYWIATKEPQNYCDECIIYNE